MPRRSKVCTLAQAASVVSDGVRLALGGSAVQQRATAFVCQLIRQGRQVLGRAYLMVPHQQLRRFLERVDYVSGAGYPGYAEGRSKPGLDHGGQKWIVTPKAILGFGRQTGHACLQSIHPGVSLDDVRESTGFPLGNDAPAITSEPTAEDLLILRRHVDPRNILIPHPAA